MINHVMQFVQTTYPTPGALAQFGCCALPATEMAVRALKNLIDLGIANPQTADDRKKYDKIGSDLAKNLSGALFYGLCAAQIVPYSATIGTICFIAYSTFKVSVSSDLKNEYKASVLLGYPLSFIFEHIVWKLFIVIGDGFEKTWNVIPLKSATAKASIMASVLLITAATVTRVVIPVIIEHLG